MIKKCITWVVLGTILIALFTGCGNTTEPTTPTLPALKVDSEKEDISQTQTTAEGFDILGGSWVVGGFYYKPNNKQYLIDLSDDDRLMDIYDTTYLFFNEDGTFLYTNLFSSRGKYTKYGDNSYILKTDTVFTYDFEKGDIVEKEDSPKSSYLITILDENTLHWGILDPQTGKLKLDSDPLVFEREDTESEYIQTHKTPLNSSSDSDNASKNGSTAKTPASDSSSSSKSSSTTTQKSSSTKKITSGMKNALQSAKDYLSVMPFSYSGLVEQLEYEGYSRSEATYAADNCGADWYAQAVKSARNYLDVMAFSRSGLIEQLEYEGYTHDQAVYGVDKVY